MAVRFSSTGLGAGDPQASFSALGFGDAVLRGIGQVMLQNNSYAGLLFLLGIGYNAPLFALAAVLPFVLVTWLFLWASATFPALRLAGASRP